MEFHYVKIRGHYSLQSCITAEMHYAGMQALTPSCPAMNIAIVIYSNDPETVWNAFRLANTSLVYDNRVSVFLLGKGVEAILVSTLQYDIQEQLGIFRETGGHMIGCGVCCESRKDEMPTLEEGLQCEMGSMQMLYGLIADADKVLTF